MAPTLQVEIFEDKEKFCSWEKNKSTLIFLIFKSFWNTTQVADAILFH